MALAEQKARILSRAFQKDGARGVVGVLAQKLKATWRRGEVWQLGRFLGMTTDIVRVDGCKFTIDKSVVPQNVIDLLLSHQYEEPERQALKEYLDPNVPVVELGACIGVVSCLSNRLLRHPEKHVVVEANPALLPILRHNRERNKCRFEIVHGAVSYGAETITFNVNENILASSLQGGKQQAVVVSTVTLERLIKDHDFERVTLLSDIEGGELQLVANEIEMLRKRVGTIIMELHDRIVGEAPTRQMLANLEAAGFKIAKRDGDVIVLQNHGISG